MAGIGYMVKTFDRETLTELRDAITEALDEELRWGHRREDFEIRLEQGQGHYARKAYFADYESGEILWVE